MQKVVAIIASVLAVASVLVGFQIAGPTAGQESARALSGSSFQAGNIISDANFYAGRSMTVDQVQSFLNAQVSSCTNNGCLRNGRYSMNTRSADAMCGAVTGGSSLSAAQILTRVGAACGISPKVMLVTLQKEQGLVTSRGPSAGVLERAMGYACPDNAGGHCDPAYAGVGNQVYWSAWQWKRYGNPAGTSNYFTWFNPGATRAIQYNVPTSCGTKAVAVQNKATAALYYYTPYTPNTAALNNLYGTGDGCSAYGNRNFWRMYSDWFGSPTGAAVPATTAAGNLETVTPTYNAVTVGGWALDTTTTASTRVEVTVGGKASSVVAAVKRPDVARAYPKSGALHGFSQQFTAAPGRQDVCVQAVAADGRTRKDLGCKTVTVLDGSPFGSLDVAKAVPTGVAVSGWAIDPETKASIGAHVHVDGRLKQKLTANQTRTDVAKAHPTYGSAHGFSATVPTDAGYRKVCAYGMDVGAGRNTVVGECRTVDVPGSRPIGSLNSATVSGSTISLRGWALDGDTTASVPVAISVDGVTKQVRADVPRTDVARRYPAYGQAHGFAYSVKAAKGTHEVCVTARNVGAGTADRQIRCTKVTVTNTAPTGRLDSVTPVSRAVQVGGWAFDGDTAKSPIAVTVTVDGVATRTTASQKRADVGRAYPSAGPAHGWSVSIPARAGSHTVCATAVDSAGATGTDTALGCRTVTVR